MRKCFILKQLQSKDNKELKDSIINKLMEIGIFKVHGLQLYQVPLYMLLHEYDKHVHN